MPMHINKDGYGYDSAVLRSSAGKYRDAAQQVDRVLAHPPTAVDAGASSGRVGKALDALIRLSAGGALAARDTADKIDATDGSYGEVEDTNAGKLKRNDLYRKHGHR